MAVSSIITDVNSINILGHVSVDSSAVKPWKSLKAVPIKPKIQLRN
jgi:hypothetical protein